MDLGQALRHYTSILREAVEEPALESRVIIQKATGLRRPVLLSHPERELSGTEQGAIEAMAARRLRGEPLPYILGEWEFFGHSFIVNQSVLIPRPETEMLVEEALTWLKQGHFPAMAFDIGTGSGCIAISLLLERPDLMVTAVDIRRDTLRTAVKNAERHGCADRFLPVRADLFTCFDTAPGLICANLPYIPTETCADLPAAVHEPMTALDGGPDGFDLYRLLFQQIRNKINKEALILCEIEYRQKDLAYKTAKEFFPERKAEVLPDLAGQPRLLRIE